MVLNPSIGKTTVATDREEVLIIDVIKKSAFDKQRLNVIYEVPKKTDFSLKGLIQKSNFNSPVVIESKYLKFDGAWCFGFKLTPKTDFILIKDCPKGFEFESLLFFFKEGIDMAGTDGETIYPAIICLTAHDLIEYDFFMEVPFNIIGYDTISNRIKAQLPF